MAVPPRSASVFVEEWQAHYGSPLQIDGDNDGIEPAELIEPHDTFAITPAPQDLPDRLAFVDGVRRGDAFLYLEDPDTGAVAYGVAGAHGCGAVLSEGGRMVCDHLESHSLAIWGSGQIAPLPEAPGGYRWQTVSIADVDHDAPLQELQRRMRQAEGELAERLAREGWSVICDGPLNFVRSTDLPVCGYVKTHRRILLAPADHARIGSLDAGQRTPLFAISDRYSCYFRLTPRTGTRGPWHGVARLETSQSIGLEAAQAVVDQMVAVLPRFAGVSHIDPRAPQNLQPVAALETELRHRLGHPRLAAIAVRVAAQQLRLAAPDQVTEGTL
jgi:hypothetical protein